LIGGDASNDVLAPGEYMRLLLSDGFRW